MQTRDLPEEAPGHYRESHPHPYYIPDKLPLSTRLDVDDELTELIADASFQLGRIDGISPTIDFSPVLYKWFVIFSLSENHGRTGNLEIRTGLVPASDGTFSR